MKKLRIHRMKYVNQGKANPELRGKREYHAIFKFDTEQEVKKFINDVKKWYYDKEPVKEVKKTPKKKTGRPPKKSVQGSK